MTGVVFPIEAIVCAKGLRDESGLDTRFLESNVYALRAVLDEEFDIVYTSRASCADCAT